MGLPSLRLRLRWSPGKLAAGGREKVIKDSRPLALRVNCGSSRSISSPCLAHCSSALYVQGRPRPFALAAPPAGRGSLPSVRRHATTLTRDGERKRPNPKGAWNPVCAPTLLAWPVAAAPPVPTLPLALPFHAAEALVQFDLSPRRRRSGRDRSEPMGGNARRGSPRATPDRRWLCLDPQKPPQNPNFPSHLHHIETLNIANESQLPT